ncbi:MAG: mechanosensitive ion channel domain-containing protein [Cyclobacteriaceae bacterium]
MKSAKSQIEVKEGRKRIFFVLKLFCYILLTVLVEFVDFESDPILSRLSGLLSALTFLLAGNILISMGRIFLVRFYLRKKQADPLQSNFVLGINRIASMLNVAVILIALMLFFEIKPFEFLSSITIVAMAIALLSKDYIINMINGLIIMFSDQITLGDHILIGEQKGRIQDITFLNVVLLNEDHDLIMVPNSLILTSQITNYSRQNVKKITFELEVKSGPGVNVDKMENTLKTETKQFGNQINNLSLKTLLILKDSVKLKLQVQLNSVPKETEHKIRRKINQTLIDISNESFG